jgi:hypothetical protein
MSDATTPFLAPGIGFLFRGTGRGLQRPAHAPQPMDSRAVAPTIARAAAKAIAAPAPSAPARPRAKSGARAFRGSFWIRHWLVVAVPILAFVAFLTLTGPVAALFIGPVDLVLVDKSAKKLWLMRNGEKLFETDVSLGRNPTGRKLREGDHRTPEGSYTLGWRDPQSDHHRAILISYPGKADIALAKQRGLNPGGGIMIHGQKYFWRWFTRSPVTDGCIGVSNVAMDIIWSAVGASTPIEIRP